MQSSSHTSMTGKNTMLSDIFTKLISNIASSHINNPNTYNKQPKSTYAKAVSFKVNIPISKDSVLNHTNNNTANRIKDNINNNPTSTDNDGFIVVNRQNNKANKFRHNYTNNNRNNNLKNKNFNHQNRFENQINNEKIIKSKCKKF